MNWVISPRALPNDPETPSITKKQQIQTTATWYLADLDSEESDSKTEAEGSGVKTAPAAHSTDEHQPNLDERPNPKQPIFTK